LGFFEAILGFLGKNRMRRFQRLAGQTDKWKALKPRVKAANVPNWAQGSLESMWESGGEVRDEVGK
jgi:hypothetical protein